MGMDFTLCQNVQLMNFRETIALYIVILTEIAYEFICAESIPNVLFEMLHYLHNGQYKWYTNMCYEF